MERVEAFKAVLAAAIAVLTARWGWFGWLVVCWVAFMALDYITGSAAALRRGEWSSATARDGLWHKLGAVVAVLVAGLLDLMVGHILGRFPDAIPLPVRYKTFLCPLVVVWYILTEAGSILENAGKLGAEYPEWLTKAVKALKNSADKAGMNVTKGGEKE